MILRASPKTLAKPHRTASKRRTLHRRRGMQTLRVSGHLPATQCFARYRRIESAYTAAVYAPDQRMPTVQLTDSSYTTRFGSSRLRRLSGVPVHRPKSSTTSPTHALTSTNSERVLNWHFDQYVRQLGFGSS